jgi:hypothetical protein
MGEGLCGAVTTVSVAYVIGTAIENPSVDGAVLGLYAVILAAVYAKMKFFSCE